MLIVTKKCVHSSVCCSFVCKQDDYTEIFSAIFMKACQIID